MTTNYLDQNQKTTYNFKDVYISKFTVYQS